MDGARVLALVKDGVGVQELKAGEAGEVVFDATSFYADSGGQVGDVGWSYSGDHNTVVAEVTGATSRCRGCLRITLWRIRRLRWAIRSIPL